MCIAWMIPNDWKRHGDIWFSCVFSWTRPRPGIQVAYNSTERPSDLGKFCLKYVSCASRNQRERLPIALSWLALRVIPKKNKPNTLSLHHGFVAAFISCETVSGTLCVDVNSLS
jgi:hypothetical protein